MKPAASLAATEDPAWMITFEHSAGGQGTTLFEDCVHTAE